MRLDVRAAEGRPVSRLSNRVFEKRLWSRSARFPTGAWPIEMRIDLVAAYLDYATTRDLWNAVERGEAPRPSAVRHGRNGREPVWSSEAVTQFVRSRHGTPGLAGAPVGVEHLVPDPIVVLRNE